MTHHGIEFIEFRDELSGIQTRTAQPERAGRNRIGDLGGIQRIGGNRSFSGDIQPLKRDAISQGIRRGRIHAVITRFSEICPIRSGTHAILFLPVVGERSVRAARKIKVPADLIEVFRHGNRTSHVGSESCPKITQSLSGMTVFATNPG